MLEQAYEMLLTGSVIVLAILVIVSMVRSVLGPGISDRIIAVNMTGTMIIMTIAILSVRLDENYLVDVCLIYAMISFLAVVVLCKVYTGVYLQQKQMKADLRAIEDNLIHQEEHTEEIKRADNGESEKREKREEREERGLERKTEEVHRS